MKKADILRLYQEYLDRYRGGGNASEFICEFLEAEDFSDVILNSGTEQRIKLVAANFRKEVTSTVLWLLQYNLQIQCYKATPYQHGETLFLNLEQIIPTPEAAEFMIGISEKENEQKTVERSLVKSKNRNSQFWEQALEQLEKHGVGLYRNVSAGKDHWLWAGSGLAAVPFSIIFLKSEARVEISIARKDKEENKRIYDLLHEKREAIEERFGAEFKWMRLDDRISCRISYGKDFDGHDPEQWPEIIDWLVEHVQRLEKAFRPEFEAVKGLLLVLNQKKRAGDCSPALVSCLTVSRICRYGWPYFLRLQLVRLSETVVLGLLFAFEAGTYWPVTALRWFFPVDFISVSRFSFLRSALPGELVLIETALGTLSRKVTLDVAK